MAGSFRERPKKDEARTDLLSHLRFTLRYVLETDCGHVRTLAHHHQVWVRLNNLCVASKVHHSGASATLPLSSCANTQDFKMTATAAATTNIYHGQM